MEFPKIAEGVKKVRVVWSIHAYLAFTSPSNAIAIQSESSNLFSIVCDLLIYAWYLHLIDLFCIEIRLVSERSKVHVMTCSHLSFYPGFISVRRESESARTPIKSIDVTVNPLTPVPPVTAHDEPWPFFHFWRHHLLTKIGIIYT